MMNQYGYGEDLMGHGFLGGAFMIFIWAAAIYFINFARSKNSYEK